MPTPSKYKPAYCNEIIECLADGHSIAGFAGSIGVARSVVYEWIKAHEEFARAHDIGKAKAVFYWEKEAKRFAKDGKGNAAVIIFALSNRAPDDWAQKVVNEHTGANGGPIKSEHKVVIEFVEAEGK